MKRFTMIALAGVLVIAMAMPAMALENVFGGYWRTRAYTNINFDGEDQDDSSNYTLVDTRTRIHYTAILNDNLKFVNKFEFDAIWGDDKAGDIGTDGNTFELKHSYADFNLGPVNAKIGMQALTVGRGFIFDDDFAGAVLAYTGEGITVPFVWMKPYEGSYGNNNSDVDFYAVAPTFTAGPASINPFLVYATSDNLSSWSPVAHIYNIPENLNTLNYVDDLDIYYGGVSVDLNLEPASVWFTGIYEGGSIDVGSESTDVSAWLLGLGGNVGLGMADVHGQVFYATGQDTSDDSEDIEAFFVPSQNDWTGQCYYWAEIMGYGTFDDTVSKNSPGDKISNIMAANIGTTIKPMDDLSISFDLWFAQLVEGISVTDANGNTSEEDELGVEVDVAVSYTLIEGLNLDLVGAYLFAGDATTEKSNDDANPYELGAQLSLSF